MVQVPEQDTKSHTVKQGEIYPEAEWVWELSFWCVGGCGVYPTSLCWNEEMFLQVALAVVLWYSNQTKQRMALFSKNVSEIHIRPISKL